LLPSGKREGIVVNTGDLHLYWFAKGRPAARISDRHREGRLCDTARVTTVKAKKEKPTWNARRIRAPRRPDPGETRFRPAATNPLGEYALYLGWPARRPAPSRRGFACLPAARVTSSRSPTTLRHPRELCRLVEARVTGPDRDSPRETARRDPAKLTSSSRRGTGGAERELA